MKTNPPHHSDSRGMKKPQRNIPAAIPMKSLQARISAVILMKKAPNIIPITDIPKKTTPNIFIVNSTKRRCFAASPFFNIIKSKPAKDNPLRVIC